MKKLLTLVLCWLIAFSAMAETTLKAQTALSAAGGYITSQNKVDGSFEDGISSWSASVGTIVKTANTEMQGNYVGVWSGTGTGTLDLLWTATASNTYEASAQIKLDVPSDYTLCAVVNGTETGCNVLSGYVANKIYKASVIADSVLGTSFYLRLKHTGSGAFSATVDDGKIKPWNLQNVQVVEQESVSYTGYSTGNNPVVFKSRDIERSNEKNLIEVLTVGVAGTASKYKILKPCIVTLSFSDYYSVASATPIYIDHYDYAGTLLKSSASSNATGTSLNSTSLTTRANPGDYFTTHVTVAPNDKSSTNFNITASAISDNVIQSYSNDRVGETIYSIQNTAPQGFISAQGSILGKTSGSHQGEAYKALYAYSWAIASATAGEPYLISSAKGASAQADWDAGKTITINESGLFTRASGGNAGAVGTKQDDAMQGHRHQIFLQNGTRLNRTDSIGSGTVPGIGLSTGFSDYPYAGNLETDGTNGTPRTASETRPINIAKYVYIRYAQSVPTLLALPTSKNNNKTYDHKQVSITGTNVSTTYGRYFPYKTINKATGLYVWRLAFNTTVNYSAAANASVISFSGITFSSGFSQSVSAALMQTAVAYRAVWDAKTISNASSIYLEGGGVFNTASISGDVELAAKPTWADEWVEPGVFVGNIQPNWRYDISSYVTATGMTSNVSHATVEKLASGGYEVSIVSSIQGVFAAGTLIPNITGIEFPIITTITGIGNLTGGSIRSYTNSPLGGLIIGPIVANETGVYFNTGKIFVQNKPTWAVNTP